MSKKIIVWLVVAVSFILISGIVFVGTMSALNWDFMRLNTTQYETNAYTINEQFKNISVNTNTIDVLFLKSDDNVCKIETIELKNEKHIITVQDETLKIDLNDTRNWYDYVTFFSFVEPQIKVYLPQDTYDNIGVSLSTGDIDMVGNFYFENIDIKGSTGDVNLNNVLAGNINIVATTGDIELESCDANEIYVKTSTGDVEGRLLSKKVFVCNTSTGDIDIPKTTGGGKCEVTTSTGDIEFKVRIIVAN